MTDYKQLYEDYHTDNPFKGFGQTTFMGDRAEATYPDAVRILDFGCGNGYAVREMRSRGRDWHGIEYSQAAYEMHLKEPYFFVGNTCQFEDQQFDMAYSTEVFEHIPEELVADTVADLCRVVSKYLFMTISLRPSSDNNKYHCTLKSRSWWESHFTAHGFEVDQPVIDLYQPRSLKSTSRILRRWSHLGPAVKAFAENPPYELHGEKQFWYFCFRRRGVQAPPLPKPNEPWHRRKLIPLLRRWASMDQPNTSSKRNAA